MTPKPNLDLIRAFAVLLVVLDHTLLATNHRFLGSWDASWIGVVGVYIFFVHTALVLMWSLERRPFVLDFYIRRVFRIYPLAVCAIWIALLSHAPVNGTPLHYFDFVPVSTRNKITATLLVQNLVYQQSNVLGVLWTLPLEVQMYVFLPFLFFFARAQKSIWPLLLIWTLSCLTCRMLFAPVLAVLPTVVPAFIPGVMAYVGFSKWRPRLPAVSLVLLLALLTTAFMAHPTSRTAWPFCLALGLALPFIRDLRARWLVRASHELAKYSYGIYLGHPFAIVLGVYLLRGHSLALQLSVEFASIALISVAAYHLIEHPLIRVGSRVAARAERHHEARAANSPLKQAPFRP